MRAYLRPRVGAGRGHFVGFELEAERADSDYDIRLELDARHSRPRNPDAVVALQIDEHIATAFEADLGV
jgi:hypothetical protein